MANYCELPAMVTGVLDVSDVVDVVVGGVVVVVVGTPEVVVGATVVDEDFGATDVVVVDCVDAFGLELQAARAAGATSRRTPPRRRRRRFIASLAITPDGFVERVCC
jgi:hypothetical protein